MTIIFIINNNNYNNLDFKMKYLIMWNKKEILRPLVLLGDVLRDWRGISEFSQSDFRQGAFMDVSQSQMRLGELTETGRHSQIPSLT